VRVPAGPRPAGEERGEPFRAGSRGRGPAGGQRGWWWWWWWWWAFDTGGRVWCGGRAGRRTGLLRLLVGVVDAGEPLQLPSPRLPPPPPPPCPLMHAHTTHTHALSRCVLAKSLGARRARKPPRPLPDPRLPSSPRRVILQPPPGIPEERPRPRQNSGEPGRGKTAEGSITAGLREALRHPAAQRAERLQPAVYGRFEGAARDAARRRGAKGAPRRGAEAAQRPSGRAPRQLHAVPRTADPPSRLLVSGIA
jgi:hypothetical protein